LRKGCERRQQSQSGCLRRNETSGSSGRSAMSIVQTVLHRHKLRQERHAYTVRSAPAPSISAFFILPSAFPSQTPAPSHSPLVGRRTCRSCRSLDGFWGARLLQTCHSYGVALPGSHSTGSSEERIPVSSGFPVSQLRTSLSAPQSRPVLGAKRGLVVRPQAPSLVASSKAPLPAARGRPTERDATAFNRARGPAPMFPQRRTSAPFSLAVQRWAG